MELTGAQMVAKSLEDEGVETIFGLPGGQVIPLYDAIYDSKLRHVLVRHEQAAAHAADGYSRAWTGPGVPLGGSVGVCVATSGPGATNLITGIATAMMDSSPMLAIAGQVPTAAIGTDAFQEAHMLGISLPVVKHSMQTRSPEDIPRAIHDALFVAATGRPGPVVIDLPADIQRARGEYRRPTEVSYPGYVETPPENLDKLGEAVDLIKKAERPVVIAGNGVSISRAFGVLREFSERLGIPVTTSLLGKGTLPGSHPNSIGMMGMHGNIAANHALIKADVIIAVGTRLSDRSTGKAAEFGIDARVIHIDLDEAEIHKNIDASVWLIGDACRVLSVLTREAAGQIPVARARWMEELREEVREEFAREPRMPEGGGIHPRRVFDALDKVTKGDAVVTTEVGQHQMWTALYHHAERPRCFLTSGGLGTMGFGIPASIGACFARPGEPVFCVAGDGSAMMNIQELDTYARYDLPIKVLIFDNNCLGMVRQWQELFYNERFSSTIYSRCPDFAGIARAMGVEAWDIHDESELRPSIERAIATPGPVLIHIPIPQRVNVFPMVPAGESLEHMLM